MQRLRDCSFQAWKRYRPRFYRGAIEFVRAEVSLNFPSNPANVWAGLAETLKVETVPGDHLSMLTTHAASTAAALTRGLKEQG